MKEKVKLNLLTVVILLVVVALITAGTVYFILSNEKEDKIIPNTKPIEIEVSFSKAKEIFEWLPKIYIPMQKPFNDKDLLSLVMYEIDSKSENPDFSETNINNTVINFFGPGVMINKEKVIDLKNTPYIYSSEDDKYMIIAMGIEQDDKEYTTSNQRLKSVEQDDERYYVETYSVTTSRKMSSEKGEKLTIIDNEGKAIKTDILQDSVDAIDKVINQYSEKLTVIKYTLQKNNDKYYIIKTEIVK